MEENDKTSLFKWCPGRSNLMDFIIRNSLHPKKAQQGYDVSTMTLLNIYN